MGYRGRSSSGQNRAWMRESERSRCGTQGVSPLASMGRFGVGAMGCAMFAVMLEKDSDETLSTSIETSGFSCRATV